VKDVKKIEEVQRCEEFTKGESTLIFSDPSPTCTIEIELFDNFFFLLLKDNIIDHTKYFT
jgi:hypothetical protein